MKLTRKGKKIEAKLIIETKFFWLTVAQKFIYHSSEEGSLPRASKMPHGVKIRDTHNREDDQKKAKQSKGEQGFYHARGSCFALLALLLLLMNL